MKFGTSGLRGLVVDLIGRPSALYATAFGKHLMDSGQVARGDPVFVGRDLRASSGEISETCIGALKRLGLEPYDCGTLPTPALALFAMSHSAPCVMITGSHIPDDRNGIKFYGPNGEIDKHDESRISLIAEQLQNEDIDCSKAVAPSRFAEASAFFEARNLNLLGQGALVGLKIGLYQHSSVARDLLQSVLSRYGADVIPLGRSAKFVSVDTEALVDETVMQLRKWATDYQLDAIVSADGDGDRPLVADEQGTPLRGDLLGLLVAEFVGAEVVVTPVTSNSCICDNDGFYVKRTKVGSPFVIEEMQKAIQRGETSVLGFEANGGVLTGNDFEISSRVLSKLPTRDSFLPILAVLKARAVRKLPLSKIVEGYRLTFAKSALVKEFPPETGLALMSYLTECDENFAAFFSPLGTVTGKDVTDGLRVALDHGHIIHIRPSGNAPELRCYSEAPVEETAIELLDRTINQIQFWQQHLAPNRQRPAA